MGNQILRIICWPVWNSEDSSMSYEYQGNCWEITKKPLGKAGRALKFTHLVLIELSLMIMTIGSLVTFIFYIHSDPSLSIPLTVFFAICCCLCVGYNLICAVYFFHFYFVIGICLFLDKLFEKD